MPVIRLNGASDEFPVAHYAKSFYGLFQNQGGLPPKIKLHAPLVTDMINMFRGSYGAMEVDVAVGSLAGGKIAHAFNSVSIQNVWLRNSISACDNLQYAFAGAALAGIYGEPLDLSSATNVSHMFGSALQTVALVPSSVKLDIQFPSGALTAASLLSIANGLNAAVAPKTLTVVAAAKAVMDALTVDNIGGTAVGGSSMSLTAFVTVNKGWSVATI